VFCWISRWAWRISGPVGLERGQDEGGWWGCGAAGQGGWMMRMDDGGERFLVGIEVLFFCVYVGVRPPRSRDQRTILLLRFFAVVLRYPGCVVTVDFHSSYLPLPRAGLLRLQIQSPLPKVPCPAFFQQFSRRLLIFLIFQLLDHLLRRKMRAIEPLTNLQLLLAKNSIR